MGLFSLFILAVGLSMDAFAVSICKGLSIKKLNLKKQIIVGCYFGFFQAIMPLIGFMCGRHFETQIKQIDHWIAFFLLSVIGINMIIGALKKEDFESEKESLTPKSMLPLAVATSIDALAVGVTLAFLSTPIVPSVSFIGIVTFTLSCVGVKIGNLFGLKFKAKAEIFGGLVLILIAIKVLFEHLGLFL